MFEIEKDYDICAEAVNGQEAIALATKHRPDLVILDLSMPVMNGYDAGK
jgi:YesN/AraC family two-component response regulator